MFFKYFRSSRNQHVEDNAEDVSTVETSPSVVQFDDDQGISANEGQLGDPPKRVTRSCSKSKSTPSPSKASDKASRTELGKKRLPLTFVKDPFSPQLTKSEEKKLVELKATKQREPRKKYSVFKKVKSKRI